MEHFATALPMPHSLLPGAVLRCSEIGIEAVNDASAVTRMANSLHSGKAEQEGRGKRYQIAHGGLAQS